MGSKIIAIDRCIKWICWISIFSFLFNFIQNLLISLVFRWHNVWNLIWEPSFLYFLALALLIFACKIKKMWLIFLYITGFSPYIILSSVMVLIDGRASLPFLNFIDYPDALITLFIPMLGIRLAYLKLVEKRRK